MEWNFFFGFDGRVNRAKCWRVTFLNIFCLMLFMLIVPLNLAGSFGNADASWAAPLSLALIIGTMGPAVIISTWCYCAIAIKRLHDRNKSGWWLAAFYGAPILLDKLWDRLDHPTLAYGVSFIGLVLSVWGFIEIFCLRGTRGPNPFGPDPLAKNYVGSRPISPATA